MMPKALATADNPSRCDDKEKRSNRNAYDGSCLHLYSWYDDALFMPSDYEARQLTLESLPPFGIKMVGRKTSQRCDTCRKRKVKVRQTQTRSVIRRIDDLSAIWPDQRALLARERAGLAQATTPMLATINMWERRHERVPTPAISLDDWPPSQLVTSP